MPLNRVADALGVVTICLVAFLVLWGLFCIIYSFYFLNRIRGQALVQLSYFNGPWIIRIAFILLAVWWGVGEILRLKLFRHNGSTLNSLSSSFQENLCKCYIASNLGFAEPCLFLTIIFLLRASLQRYGTLSIRWNVKTAGYVVLYCFPIFTLQLVVILFGPTYERQEHSSLPSYFIKTSHQTSNGVILCTYPLLSTIFMGLFATILTAYLFYLGRCILHLVINKGLQKRVHTLIFCISSFFPLRVILLGLTVLFHPEKLPYDAISFLAFVCLLCCTGVGICVLVYLPVADSLSLRSQRRETETGMRTTGEYNDTASLIANQTPLGRSPLSSSARDSTASDDGRSISFRTTGVEGTSGAAFVELSLFAYKNQYSALPDSDCEIGWPRHYEETSQLW